MSMLERNASGICTATRKGSDGRIHACGHDKGHKGPHQCWAYFCTFEWAQRKKAKKEGGK